jgi:hypothetical protein
VGSEAEASGGVTAAAASSGLKVLRATRKRGVLGTKAGSEGKRHGGVGAANKRASESAAADVTPPLVQDPEAIGVPGAGMADGLEGERYPCPQNWEWHRDGALPWLAHTRGSFKLALSVGDGGVIWGHGAR